MGYLLPNGNVETQFAKKMVSLAEVLGVTITESRIRVYARLLSDISPEDISRACASCANEPRDPNRPVYFPTPGQLRGYIQTSADDEALVAWSDLSRAVERYGAYTSVRIADPVAALALVAVFSSWPNFCQMDDGPSLAQKRQEFIAQYRALRRKEYDGNAKYLPGLCELSGSYDREKSVVGQIGERRSGRQLASRNQRALPKADTEKQGEV